MGSGDREAGKVLDKLTHSKTKIHAAPAAVAAIDKLIGTREPLAIVGGKSKLKCYFDQRAAAIH